MKKFITNLSTCAMQLRCGVLPQLPERAKKERGDQLLQTIGIIAIAVAILIIFRHSLIDLFNSALETTTNAVTNLFNTTD